MNITRITTLLNEETGEVFNIDDVIEITTEYDVQYFGKILSLEDIYLRLDVGVIEFIRYSEIVSIKKIDYMGVGEMKCFYFRQDTMEVYAVYQCNNCNKENIKQEGFNQDSCNGCSNKKSRKAVLVDNIGK